MKFISLYYDGWFDTSHGLDAGASDTGHVKATLPTASELVAQIRSEIADELGITASAGIAHSLLLARMCTRKAKPDGQLQLQTDKIEEFLADEPVEDLPGV